MKYVKIVDNPKIKARKCENKVKDYTLSTYNVYSSKWFCLLSHGDK